MKIWSRTYLTWFKSDTGSTILRCVRLVRNKRPVARVISVEGPHPGLDRIRRAYRSPEYSGPDIAPGPYDDEDRDWFDQTVERKGRESFEPPPGR